MLCRLQVQDVIFVWLWFPAVTVLTDYMSSQIMNCCLPGMNLTVEMRQYL